MGYNLHFCTQYNKEKSPGIQLDFACIGKETATGETLGELEGKMLGSYFTSNSTVRFARSGLSVRGAVFPSMESRMSRIASILPARARSASTLTRPSPYVAPSDRPSLILSASGNASSTSSRRRSEMGRFLGRPPGLPDCPALKRVADPFSKFSSFTCFSPVLRREQEFAPGALTKNSIPSTDFSIVSVPKSQ